MAKIWKMTNCHKWDVFWDTVRRMGQKMVLFFVHLIMLPNINQFSRFFHCQHQETTCNKTITRFHPNSSVSLHCLVKCQCLKSNNKKQDNFCNNIFLKINKETTCLLSQLLSQKSHLTVFSSNV